MVIHRLFRYLVEALGPIVLLLGLVAGMVTYSTREAMAKEVPSPAELKQSVKAAFGKVHSVGFRCETLARKSAPKSGELFLFSIERTDVAMVGQRFSERSVSCSRAGPRGKYELSRSESGSFGDESSRLRIRWHDVASLAEGQEFIPSLLKDTDKLDKKNPEVAFGALSEDPRLQIAVLNGRFPGFSKSNIYEFIDDESEISEVTFEGRTCYRMAMKREKFKAVFDFCPELNYAVVEYKITDFFEDGKTAIRHAMMKNVEDGARSFELHDRYEEFNPDGEVSYWQVAELKYSDVRFDIDEAQLARHYQLKDGTPVQIDKTPFLDAAWENGEIVLTHNEKIVDGMSKASLLPAVDSSPKQGPKSTLILVGLAMLAGLTVVLLRRK